MDRNIRHRTGSFVRTLSILTLLSATLLTGCKAPNLAETELGTTKGTFNFKQRTIEWKGIPYAKAPLGDLRWHAPQPHDPWEGIHKADSFSQACMQLGSMVAVMCSDQAPCTTAAPWYRKA